MAHLDFPDAMPGVTWKSCKTASSVSAVGNREPLGQGVLFILPGGFTKRISVKPLASPDPAAF